MIPLAPRSALPCRIIDFDHQRISYPHVDKHFYSKDRTPATPLNGSCRTVPTTIASSREFAPKKFKPALHLTVQALLMRVPARLSLFNQCLDRFHIRHHEPICET